LHFLKMEVGMMEAKEKFIVDGFEFATKKEATAAQKEVESVKYIKEKVKHDNSDKLLSMYNKLIEENVFKTPVGISYLRELQGRLYRSGVVEEDMLPITYSVSVEKSKETTEDKKDSRFKAPFITSLIINAVMAIIIIVMIYIASTTTSPTILDYEVKLQNKYAGWAEELKDKENDLNKLQKELEASSKNSQN